MSSSASVIKKLTTANYFGGRGNMLHSKLVTMRVGGTATLMKATETFSRLQFVIENGVNGSMVAATTQSPRRHQHILCAKPPTTVQSSTSNVDYVKYHSVLSKKTTPTTTTVSVLKH